MQFCLVIALLLATCSLPVVSVAGEAVHLRFIFERANHDVRIIYPSDSGPKPLGCVAASVSDWLASMGVSTKLASYTEGLDTDPNFVDQGASDTSGKAIAPSKATVVTFGGPVVNPVIKYAESDSTPLADRAPIMFFFDGVDTFYFRHSDGTIVPNANLPVSVINLGKDMFVIETYCDADGRYMVLCYGFGWKGTYAASKYFDQVIYPHIKSYPVSWVIVKWEDTNGNGFVNNPADGDTYSIIASG